MFKFMFKKDCKGMEKKEVTKKLNKAIQGKDFEYEDITVGSNIFTVCTENYYLYEKIVDMHNPRTAERCIRTSGDGISVIINNRFLYDVTTSTVLDIQTKTNNIEYNSRRDKCIETSSTDVEQSINLILDNIDSICEKLI